MNLKKAVSLVRNVQLKSKKKEKKDQDVFKLALGRNSTIEVDEFLSILKKEPSLRKINPEQLFILKKYFQGKKFFIKISKLFEENNRQLGFLLDKFIKAIQLKEYNPGDIIQKEGDKHLNFMLFLSGKANVVVQKSGEQVQQEENQFINQILHPHEEMNLSPLKKRRSCLIQQRENKISQLRKQTRLIQNWDNNLIKLQQQQQNYQINVDGSSPLKRKSSISGNSPLKKSGNFMNTSQQQRKNLDLSSSLVPPRQKSMQMSMNMVKGIGSMHQIQENSEPESYSDSSDYLSDASFQSVEQNPLYECFFESLQHPLPQNAKIIQKQTTGFKQCFGELKNHEMVHLKDFIKNNVLQVQYGSQLREGDTTGSADILKARNRTSESIVALTNVRVVVLNSKDFSEILSEPEDLKFEKKLDFLSKNIGIQFKNPISFLINKLKKVRKFKGQKIYSQNDTVNGCYILKHGEVEISRQVALSTPQQYLNKNSLHQTQSQKTVHIQMSLLTPGQYLGEDEILKKEKKRLFNATCTCESKLYFIELIHYKKLIQDNPNLYLELLNKVSTKIEWQNEKLENQSQLFQQQYEKGYQKEDIKTSKEILQYTMKKCSKQNPNIEIQQQQFSQQVQQLKQEKQKSFHNKIRLKDIERLQQKQKAMLVQQLKKPFRDYSQALDFDEGKDNRSQTYVKKVKLKQLQFRNFSFWPQNYKYGLIFEEDQTQEEQKQHKLRLQQKMEDKHLWVDKDDIHIQQQDVYEKIFEQQRSKLISGKRENIQQSKTERNFRKRRDNDKYIQFKEQFIYQQTWNAGFKSNRAQSEDNNSVSSQEERSEMTLLSDDKSFHISDIEDKDKDKKQPQNTQNSQQDIPENQTKSLKNSMISFQEDQQQQNTSQPSLNVKTHTSQATSFYRNKNNNRQYKRLQSAYTSRNSPKKDLSSQEPEIQTKGISTSKSFIAPKIKLCEVQKTDAISKHFTQKYKQKKKKINDSKYKIVKIENLSKKTISNAKGIPFLEHELMRDPQSRGKIINSIRKATNKEKLLQDKKDSQKLNNGSIAFMPLFEKIKATVITEQDNKPDLRETQKLLDDMRFQSTARKEKDSTIDQDNISQVSSQQQLSSRQFSRQKSRKEPTILSQVDLFGQIQEISDNPQHFLTKMSSIELKHDDNQSRLINLGTSAFNTPRNLSPRKRTPGQTPGVQQNPLSSNNTSIQRLGIQKSQSQQFSKFQEYSNRQLTRDNSISNTNIQTPIASFSQTNITNNNRPVSSSLFSTNRLVSQQTLGSQRQINSKQQLSQQQKQQSQQEKQSQQQLLKQQQQSQQQLQSQSQLQLDQYICSENPIQTFSYTSQNIDRKRVNIQQGNHINNNKKTKLQINRVQSARLKSADIGSKFNRQILNRQLSQVADQESIRRINQQLLQNQAIKSNIQSQKQTPQHSQEILEIDYGYNEKEPEKQDLANTGNKKDQATEFRNFDSTELSKEKGVYSIPKEFDNIKENSHMQSHSITQNETISHIKSNEMVEYYNLQQSKQQSQTLQTQQPQTTQTQQIQQENPYQQYQLQPQQQQKKYIKIQAQNPEKKQNSSHIKLKVHSNKRAASSNIHVQKKKSQYVTIVNHMGKPIKYNF